jgi:hypothetical protein
MTADQAAEILLVRAIEESDSVPVSHEGRVDSLEAAGELDDEESWFARRAEFLLEHVFHPYASLLAIRDVLSPGLLTNLGIPFLLGLSSNYLGPRNQIHVLYNPIVFLLVWNLAAYAVMGARRALWERLSSAAPELPTRPEETDGPRAAAKGSISRRSPRRLGIVGWILRRTAAHLWIRVHRGVAEGEQEARAFASVGRRFWKLWDASSRPLFVPSTRRILHVAAVGVALGAVAGMFARGLFFDYHVVWRSTFIHDPDTIGRLLGLLLGAGALIGGQSIPSAGDARALMAPEGMAAAPWIQIYALSIGLFVVLPRTALALLAGRQSRIVGSQLDLHLEDPYYAEILAAAPKIRQVREEIRTEARIECGKFAEAVAVFVAEQLYAGRIAPSVRDFRERGGRITDLEQEIREKSEAFQGELSSFLTRAQADFEQALSRAVQQRIGKSLSIPDASQEVCGTLLQETRDGAVENTGGAVSSQIARPVAAAVTAGVATVAGTVSGGLGKTVGVALVATLFGTTGPVGFLIGAVVAAVAVVAAAWIGQNRVKEGVNRIRLPSRVLKMALPRKRLERLLADGHDRCRTSVRELMAQKLEPTTAELSDQIWNRVKPFVDPASQDLGGRPETDGLTPPRPGAAGSQLAEAKE